MRLFATLIFKAVEEILWCYHSNGTSCEVLFIRILQNKFNFVTFLVRSEKVKEVMKLLCSHTQYQALSLLQNSFFNTSRTITTE